MTLQGAHILIVEDEILVAMTAGDMIREFGGVVAGTASSVPVALRQIEELHLDCVMLDVNLRGTMSFAVAARLSELCIPFFFCTAYSHVFDGFEHVPRMLKPYSAKELAKGLQAVLASGARRRDACQPLHRNE